MSFFCRLQRFSYYRRLRGFIIERNVCLSTLWNVFITTGTFHSWKWYRNKTMNKEHHYCIKFIQYWSYYVEKLSFDAFISHGIECYLIKFSQPKLQPIHSTPSETRECLYYKALRDQLIQWQVKCLTSEGFDFQQKPGCFSSIRRRNWVSGSFTLPFGGYGGSLPEEVGAHGWSTTFTYAPG
jgi:hypothetical protein